MKAAIYRRYGPPDVLQIKDIEKPEPKDDEVLLKVRAAGVNPLDSHLMKGRPYILRILLGLGKPKIKRPGVDVSGEAEAVGSNVTQFKPGDAVFGMCKGTFAEYVCAAESAVVIKPDNITFEQAASAPVAALTALQGLRDKAHIQPGQRVLVNGAAGGVGTSPYRSPSRSVEKSPAFAAPGTWTWSDPSAGITSLTTLLRACAACRLPARSAS